MGLKRGRFSCLSRSFQYGVFAGLVAAVTISFTVEAWCGSRNAQTAVPVMQTKPRNSGDLMGSIFVAGKNNRGFEKNYQEWQSLTPQEKDTMRHRMNQLNQMPLQDRQHFQRLFNQWQQLSPGERRQIERALDKWDQLPAQEKESIRKRFK